MMRDYRNYPVSILTVSFYKDSYTYFEARDYLIKNLSRGFIDMEEDDNFYTFILNTRLRLESESRLLYNDTGDIVLEYEMCGEVM